MGGKNYYCDYCERSFKDAAGARKKHLISMQHIKNKNLHYRQFKGLTFILFFKSVANCHNRLSAQMKISKKITFKVFKGVYPRKQN